MLHLSLSISDIQEKSYPEGTLKRTMQVLIRLSDHENQKLATQKSIDGYELNFQDFPYN